MAWVSTEERLPEWSYKPGSEGVYEDLMVCGIDRDGNRFREKFRFAADVSKHWVDNLCEHPENHKPGWLRLGLRYSEPIVEFYEEDQKSILYWFEWDWPENM